MLLRNILYGLILGIGFIIPGVSGSVLASILGIYEDIIFRLNNLFKNLKDNLLYLGSLLIGFSLGIILFSKIILKLLDTKYIFISYVFIGLILGSIPYLIKEIKNKCHKNIAFIPFIIASLISITLYIIQIKYNISSDKTTIVMIIGGLFYAIGKIIPGISGSALLILLGIYKYLLNILSNPFNINTKDIINLIPFIISFIISAIILLKLINYLLNNYYHLSYSAIIGFVISSCIFIYPNYFSFSCIIIILFSFNISYYLSN